GVRRARVSLFICRSRRSFGLHRGDGAVGTCPKCYQTNRARSQHSRRFHRRVPILEGQTFFVEIILAVRAAFGAGSLSRRSPAIAGVGLKDSNWARAALFGGASDIAPW